VFLIIIACKADDLIGAGHESFAVASIALSFIPAPLMLAVLWWDARQRVAPLKVIADDIEARAITDG
jgi:hypothetical protein